MRRDQTVGFLHPGAMGETLGAQCQADRRLWVANGRSVESATRAGQAGLVDVGSLDALTDEADVIVSICPPGAAAEQAAAVAATGFAGIYLDANAIAPATARRIGAMFSRFVDGGVVGPPAHTPGSTRLYLSGPEAASVANLWADSFVDARVVSDEPGAASALKMAYAAWTKGSSALLIAVRALAEVEGVGAALTDEWNLSQAGLGARHDSTLAAVTPKAWRFVDEMHEIAKTFEGAELPDGFHLAAAEIYRRLDAGTLTTRIEETA